MDKEQLEELGSSQMASQSLELQQHLLDQVLCLEMK